MAFSITITIATITDIILEYHWHIVWLVIGIAIMCATIMNAVTDDNCEGAHNSIQLAFLSNPR